MSVMAFDLAWDLKPAGQQLSATLAGKRAPAEGVRKAFARARPGVQENPR